MRRSQETTKQETKEEEEEPFFDFSRKSEKNFGNEIKNLAIEIQKQLEWLDQSESEEFTWGKIPIEAAPEKIVINEGQDYSFPLTEVNCKDLIKQASRSEIAHFGHGSKVDLDQRKSWSIGAEKIQILSQNGSPFEVSQSLLEIVRNALVPLSSTITTKLYKLLIYEKGDFFRGHVDSQYNEKQFGTLMIQLPTNFTGGDLLFGDQKKENSKNRLRLGSDSDSDPFLERSYEEVNELKFFFVGWLGNVSHEVEKIKFGHRVVLIYQLFHDGCQSDSPPPTSFRNGHLIKLFRELSEKKFPEPIPIGAIMFTKYDYSFSTLQLDGNFLHGQDALLYQMLRSAHLRVAARNVLMHQHYEDIVNTNDYLNKYDFDGECYLTDFLNRTDHRCYTDLYDDEVLPTTWKPAPSVRKMNVLYFDIAPNKRFCHGSINENCNDGRYGNWDCGPGFYYRETAILIALPGKMERAAKKRRIIALMVSYQENGNILFLLRTKLFPIFQLLVSMFI